MTAVAAFAVDFISKKIVLASSMNVSQNSGISFGLLKNSSGSVILLLNCFAALFLLLIGLNFAKKSNKTAMYGAALMFGGCAGNLCERLFSGGITDWIYIPFSTVLFNNGLMLNIADFAVIIGFCLIFCSLFDIKGGLMR